MKKFLSLLLPLALFLVTGPSAQAQEPMIGEIRMFAGNFAPRGFAFCNGQLLPISQYTALFSILGTTYGGDGRTTFALPDLRGRVPMHHGSGPGLDPIRLGQKTKKYISGLPGKERIGETQSGLAISYIIALNGIFPSRN